MSRRRDDYRISVVMPVHNALPYLDEAVESILAQTCGDFEFVIYDDASTDGSYDRLQEWARRDARIKLHRGQENLGPAESSHRVVCLASMPLIARMDADDISAPQRLERQARLLDENGDVGIVASLCDTIDTDGRKLREVELWRLMRKSLFTPFPHGSMMFRRDLYDRLGGYRKECAFWEDLDLVLRASEMTRILVVPEPLYRYRQSDTSTRIVSPPARVENAIDLRYQVVDRARRGGDYDDLLRQPAPAEAKRIDPRVFVSLGGLALSAGERPKLIRRFLQRANIAFDGRTALSIAWLAWASASPSTLRKFMNWRSRIRNAAVRGVGQTTEPIEWKPAYTGAAKDLK
jgi:glycosyltransferase involved in cell wall biosynthesis